MDLACNQNTLSIHICAYIYTYEIPEPVHGSIMLLFLDILCIITTEGVSYSKYRSNTQSAF